MNARSELVLYLGTFVLFTGVLLWADEATLPIVLIAGGLLAVLVAVAAWQIRHVQRILVVGQASAQMDRLEEAVERAGYEVCWCGGPSNRPCPVFRGKQCPLAERPLAAIVYRAEGERARYAPCGAALRIPEVIVEEHLDADPETVGRTARMGLDRGPDRVVREMEQLLA